MPTIAKKEKTSVQINYNHFRSFGFDEGGLEEKIHNILCAEFIKFESKEKIQAVPKEMIYTTLLETEKESDIAKALATLQKTKGGYCIIKETKDGIMPGLSFGILR